MASPAAAANPAPSASPAEVRAEVPAPAPQRTLSAEYQELERRRIIEALEACGGNQSRAATVLGISRKTLVTRIGEFGLPRPRKR
jgi:DNA-binding NtrC family response regulator